MSMDRLKQALDATQQRTKDLVEEMARAIDDLDRRWTLIGISRKSKSTQTEKRTSSSL